MENPNQEQASSPIDNIPNFNQASPSNQPPLQSMPSPLPPPQDLPVSQPPKMEQTILPTVDMAMPEEQSGNGKKIIIGSIVGVIVLGGLAVGGYFWFQQKNGLNKLEELPIVLPETSTPAVSIEEEVAPIPVPISAEESIVDTLVINEFFLPSYGSLIIKTPADWIVTYDKAQSLPRTVTLDSSEKDFSLLITAIEGGQTTLEGVKTLVESQAMESLKLAVETSYIVNELNGTYVKGYYSDLLTDREYEDVAPLAGEYKYLSQGVLLIDDLSLTFTILTNDSDRENFRKNLEILENIEHQQ